MYFVKSGEFLMSKKVQSRSGFPKKIKCQLGLRCESEMIGGEEVLTNQKTRDFSCELQSKEGILYRINKNVKITQDFLSRILSGQAL